MATYFNQQSIGDVLITKFSDSIYERAQQIQARTRQCADIVQVQAENMYFPRIASFEASLLNTRFPEIQPADVLWDNRVMQTNRIGVAVFVDQWDVERMLSDPQSELAKRAGEALEREFDRIYIGALNATVYTGRTGATQVTAATDGVLTTDATAGLTYEVLLQISANYQSNEVGIETMDEKFLLISEQEHQQLMKEGTLISGDFTRQYVVEDGYMIQAMDFKIIRFGSNVTIPMMPVSGTTRTCFSVVKGGVKVGITDAWDVRQEDRNDRWKTKQILADGVIGAVRMEGVKVQLVTTTVTPNPP